VTTAAQLGRPASGRRRLAWAVGLGALAVVAWGLLAGLQLLRVRADLVAGRDALERAARRDSPKDLADGVPAPILRHAAAQFADARRELDAPVLAPARVLPVLGRQLRSLRALTGAAHEVSATSAAFVDEGRRLLDAPRGTGPERLTLLDRFDGLARRTDAALGGVDLGPRAGLVAPLARARNELIDRLAEVRAGLARGIAGTRAARSMLAGPSRYLLLVGNNAEMRAGSGMFLLAGTLDAADGRLRLGDLRSVTDIAVPPGAVAAPADIAARWGWLTPTEEWRNLMLSPRFDANAEMAAAMWEAAGQGRVDGVLAVDAVFLQEVMRATGPADVDGRTIRPEGALREVLHDQYVRFGARERAARQESTERLARAVFDRLDAGRWDAVALVQAMQTTARGRHLMAWSRRPAEQAGWDAAGVAGRIGPESLLVAVMNRGGNKLDPYLAVSAELSFRPAGSATDAILAVTVANRVGPGEPATIAGPTPENPAGYGVYTGILAVTLPGTARQGRIEGVGSLAVAGPDGPTRVVGTQIVVRPGERRTWVVRFRLPRHGTLRAEPSARVPTLSWVVKGVRLSGAEASRVEW
jgi:hypothetical protein